jgi:hypothetical protein
MEKALKFLPTLITIINIKVSFIMINLMEMESMLIMDKQDTSMKANLKMVYLYVYIS